MAVAGKPRQYVWNKATTRYLPDTSPGTPLTRAFLLAALQPGDALTFTGTPPGLGTARGRDRDKDGIPDGDEPVPLPGLWHFPVLTLTWESATPEWYPEASARPLQGPWEPFTAPPLPSSGTAWRLPVSEGPAVRVFRLRRTSYSAAYPFCPRANSTPTPTNNKP